jgi:hypothetical protein
MTEGTDERPWRAGASAEVTAWANREDNTAAALQARQAKLRWLRDHPCRLPDPTLMRRRSAPTLDLINQDKAGPADTASLARLPCCPCFSPCSTVRYSR